MKPTTAKVVVVMSANVYLIEVLRSVSRSLVSTTVRAEEDWTVVDLLDKAGLSRAEEVVIATRSSVGTGDRTWDLLLGAWEYCKKLEARSTADRSVV